MLFFSFGLYACFADCELIALLEDDTGMELLVRNKIISLDLPVKDVYKKIWGAQPNVSPSFEVYSVYFISTNYNIDMFPWDKYFLTYDP